MKSRSMLAIAIPALLMLLVACSPAPKEASAQVSCDDFYKERHISKEVEVPVGGSLTVTLCSNPTTGFQWSELAQISDESVLQQTDHEFSIP